MRTRITFSVILAIGLISFWSCENSTSAADTVADAAKKTTEAVGTAANAVGDAATAMVDMGGVVPKDTISEDTAKAWIKAWGTVISTPGMPDIKGYVLPIVDLQQVITAGADSARFYLGQEPSGEYKLMLVGVNSQGQDMVNTSPNTPLDRIYDLSSPCPPACGSLVEN